jgi:hypothetical protein
MTVMVAARPWVLLRRRARGEPARQPGRSKEAGRGWILRQIAHLYRIAPLGQVGAALESACKVSRDHILEAIGGPTRFPVIEGLSGLTVSSQEES